MLMRYLKQHRLGLLAAALCVAIFAGCFALYRLPLRAVLYPALLCLLVGGCCFALDYVRTLRRHRAMRESCKAALLAQLPAPRSLAEADDRALIEALRAQILAQQTASDEKFQDMTEYYTAWAHQIKTPIAAMRLTLQNEDTPSARRLSAELFRVEQYVGMVMTYLRLDSASTDYVFRPCAVDDIVREAVKKFSHEFIDRRLRLDLEPTGLTVVTDEKWLGFVLEQVLSNALKYTRQGCIRIGPSAPQVLCIADTGIGIAPEDLPRIFEKGYTGQNGRVDRRASGIGLYLCRRVCERLGVGISAQSEPGRGTRVFLNLEQYDLHAE